MEPAQLTGMGVFAVPDDRGNIAAQSVPTPTAVRAQGTMIALHAERFTRVGLRFIYFFLGLLGSAVVGRVGFMNAKTCSKNNESVHWATGFWLADRLNAAAMLAYSLLWLPIFMIIGCWVSILMVAQTKRL